MLETIVQFFSTFPHWLATILMAMTPVGELRLSIPVSILGYRMPVWEVMILSIFGTMIPAVLIMLFVKPFHDWMEKRSSLFGREWIRILRHIQDRFAGRYEKYGLAVLLILFSIPFPGFGAWSGGLAAFVFGIPFRKAWPYLVIGTIIAAFLTLIVTVGADKIF
jgi:uncharacterized membrane protein